MDIIFGTGNAAKLTHMQGVLERLGIRVIGLNEIPVPLPTIDEAGNNPLENARLKSWAYYKAIGKPIFSCDSGLFIDGAPDDVQPGVNVRNVGGKYLSDDEMIEYYQKLAKSLGGKARARYKNAICLVMGEDESYEYMADDISGEEFILTDEPHTKRNAGFPLDSLSIHIETGKYYYDITEPRFYSSLDEGFRNFFRRALGINGI